MDAYQKALLAHIRETAPLAQGIPVEGQAPVQVHDIEVKMVKTDHSGSLSFARLRRSGENLPYFIRRKDKFQEQSSGIHFSHKLDVSLLCRSAEKGHTPNASRYPVTISQDHGANQRVRRNKHPRKGHTDPAGLKGLLSILALCSTQLASKICGGRHGSRQTSRRQDGNSNATHGQTNLGSKTPEHLRKDLDLIHSGRLNAKSAYDRGRQHHTGGSSALG